MGPRRPFSIEFHYVGTLGVDLIASILLLAASATDEQWAAIVEIGLCMLLNAALFAASLIYHSKLKRMAFAGYFVALTFIIVSVMAIYRIA